MVAPLIPLTTAMAYGGLIGIAIVAFAYMAAHFFNSNAMRAWAKQEIVELIAAAVIVMIIVQMVGAPELFLRTAIPQETPPILDTQLNPPGVEKRMYERMEQPLIQLEQALLVSGMRLSKLVSYNYNYQMSGAPYINPTGSASPGAGGNMLQYALNMGVDSLSLVLLLAQSMKIIYVFLSYTSILILLPLGIILRFIPPVRQAGAMLMAIGLVVVFVYPLSVFWTTNILWNPLFSSPVPGDSMVPYIDNPPSSGLICSTAAAVVVNVGEDITSYILKALVCADPFTAELPICADVSRVNPANPPIPTGPGLQHYVALGFYVAKLATAIDSSNTLKNGSPSSGDMVSKGFEPLQRMLVNHAVPRGVAVLFMCVLQLIISIVMVKNIAQALGAENQLYGLSRLV